MLKMVKYLSGCQRRQPRRRACLTPPSPRACLQTCCHWKKEAVREGADPARGPRVPDRRTHNQAVKFPKPFRKPVHLVVEHAAHVRLTLHAGHTAPHRLLAGYTISKSMPRPLRAPATSASQRCAMLIGAAIDRQDTSHAGLPCHWFHDLANQLKQTAIDEKNLQIFWLSIKY